jgi:hypothetical protein
MGPGPRSISMIASRKVTTRPSFISELLESSISEVYDEAMQSERSMHRESKKIPMPEEQLRELQKRFSWPITDSDDLRQPYRNANERRHPTLVTETFTTYGAYEDPI